jgi:hypothetical protein
LGVQHPLNSLYGLIAMGDEEPKKLDMRLE